MVVWSTRASKILKEHCIFMNRWLKDSRNLTGQSLIQIDWVECVNWPLWFCGSGSLPCRQAITTPAMAVSHIMLEAYKKYILVSLILHGKVQPLPKYTSQIVGRFIKVRTGGACVCLLQMRKFKFSQFSVENCYRKISFFSDQLVYFLRKCLWRIFPLKSSILFYLVYN